MSKLENKGNRQRKILAKALRESLSDVPSSTTKGSTLHLVEQLLDNIDKERSHLSGFLGEYTLIKDDITGKPSEGEFYVDTLDLSALTKIELHTFNSDSDCMYVPLKCAPKAYSLLLYRSDVSDPVGFIQFKTNANPAFNVNASTGIGTVTLTGVKRHSGHPLLEVGHTYELYYLKY